jgi:hypothetical protein
LAAKVLLITVRLLAMNGTTLVTVRITDTAQPGSVITNTATIASPVTESDASNNSDSVQTTLGRVLNVDTGDWFADIQPAIDDAQAGHTISVTVGTYNEDVTVDSGITVWMPASVTLNGTLANNGTLRQIKDVNATSVSFLDFGGYGGVDIDPRGLEALGTTTVTIRGNQQCTTEIEGVRRCFDISPQNTTGVSASITFYFDAGELAGLNCNFLAAYRWTGSRWQALNVSSRE